MVRKLLWWTACGVSAMLSIFFLFVGISLCIASYKLDHPHHFILTFFASNLIILISAVVIVAVIVRVIARLRHGEPQSSVEGSQLTPDSSGSADPSPDVHEVLSRNHEDGCATWQRQGVGSEAYLNGTSQEPTPEDARKDGHIRGRSR